MEVWKDIEGYEGYYQISSFGRVKSLPRTKKNCWGQDVPLEGQIMSQQFRLGYLRVTLSKDGANKSHSVHRLVAEAFIPNPNNYPEINHKNEVKDDNRVENLEWCDRKYNVNYGTGQQRRANNMRGRKLPEWWVQRAAEGKKKPIIGICLLNGEKRPFKSAADASRELGLHNSAIYGVLSGKYKRAGNWTFIYANSEEKEATND